MTDLKTTAKNTWCPGCGNFAILNAAKSVISSLVEEGHPVENFVLVSGIGCHAKIADYISINSFYSIHGRVAPTASGIKIANPRLKVIGFAGDGDSYGEGLEHVLFAAKRNIDITMIFHNNGVYGLTTGQFSPTSPFGFKGKSTPGGSMEKPFNPLELMAASGATFVARAYSHGIELLKKVIREAILHEGFSAVDVLQVCVTYFNMYDYYNERVYEATLHDPSDVIAAKEKMAEWDYKKDSKIPLGIFLKKEEPVFDKRLPKAVNKKDRPTPAKVLKTF
jgi:2-oxoglutarate/2-oxoacid ferredoxin oxidoreductase subunit beta